MKQFPCRYYWEESDKEYRIYDRAQSTEKVKHYIAIVWTVRTAKLLANALNKYRPKPKVSRPQAAEKQK